MKAIINVPKGSSYANRNGLTFDVFEILSKVVVLDIEGITTDFSFKEVLIVDIQEEVKNYTNTSGLSKNDERIFFNLLAYQQSNGIFPYNSIS
jgi:hypothetical protein